MTDTDQPYHVDRIYFGLIKDVLENGVDKSDRTGTGTRSVFGRQVRYDLSKGFPILTSKRVHWKSVVGELLWFLQGNTNVKWLNDNGITIWDEWATKEQCAKFGREKGELGPIYGHLWRRWEGVNRFTPTTPKPEPVFFADGTPAGFSLEPFNQFRYMNPDNPTEAKEANTLHDLGISVRKIDQIKNLIAQIKSNPDSRRLIVTGWNPATCDKVALPPCHTLFQFYVANGKLSCQLYQRSCDLGLGQPFNVASYALLTHMIAQVCDLEVGEFIHTFGDLHVYSNHIEALSQQLHRTPYPMPRLILDPSVKDIDGFGFDKITLDSYQHHPTIKLPVAV